MFFVTERWCIGIPPVLYGVPLKYTLISGRVCSLDGAQPENPSTWNDGAAVVHVFIVLAYLLQSTSE